MPGRDADWRRRGELSTRAGIEHIDRTSVPRETSAKSSMGSVSSESLESAGMGEKPERPRARRPSDESAEVER